MAYLKQPSLFSGSSENSCIQTPLFRIHTIQLAVFFILLCYHLCNSSFAAHSYTKAAIIYLAIVAALYQVPNLIGPVRKIFKQPIAE